MPTNGQFQDLTTLPASDINTLLTRGYSNRIINGAFVINQRGYTSGTNLAVGAYGFDRWKSGAANTSLTFTAGSQSTTVTLNQDRIIQQIVERENMPAGTYTLSWTGDATGRVYNVGGTAPAYAASPIIVSLDGLANVVVEFTATGAPRTLALVQLEGGNVFSPFEYRHRQQELALCQRYYWRIYGRAVSSSRIPSNGTAFSSNSWTGEIYHPVPMRDIATSMDASQILFTDRVSWDSSLTTAGTLNANASTLLVAQCGFTGASGVLSSPSGIPVLLNSSSSSFIGFSAEL
jgi:hypothetical protein